MNDSRKKIKIVFERSDLSQAAFAKKVGITESYVSKLLNPKKEINPSVTLIKSICVEFNLESEWFYGKKGKQVAESIAEYGLPPLNSEERDLIEKAREIITSKTAYRKILISNIDTLYKAMRDDDKKDKSIEKPAATGASTTGR